MKLPTISSYGEYSSSNYSGHCLMIDIGNMRVWFSYETPVAYHDGNEFVIRENDWSTTTGKHLNWIDSDKSKRISGEKFEEKLQKALETS